MAFSQRRRLPNLKLLPRRRTQLIWQNFRVQNCTSVPWREGPWNELDSDMYQKLGKQIKLLFVARVPAMFSDYTPGP